MEQEALHSLGALRDLVCRAHDAPTLRGVSLRTRLLEIVACAGQLILSALTRGIRSFRYGHSLGESSTQFRDLRRGDLGAAIGQDSALAAAT